MYHNLHMKKSIRICMEIIFIYKDSLANTFLMAASFNYLNYDYDNLSYR